MAFTQLGSARLWDRDEPRNAECAREMLVADNWIVPTFDGELRTHKPILLYWCQIVCYKLFGVNEWGARLPSAIAGVLTSLCAYSISRKLAGPSVATWSAISLSTMLLFAMATRAATPDSLLIFTTTLTITLFVHYAFTSSATGLDFRWPEFHQWVIIYSASGLGMLAKGPVGVVLPMAVIGLTTLLMPRRSGSNLRRVQQVKDGLLRFISHGWRMRPFTALAMVAIIAGPWYLAVGWQTNGVWLREFFLQHNVGRAMVPMEGHSGPPVLFYVGALLFGTFPWSCFSIPIGIVAYKTWQSDEAKRPIIALGMAWIIVYVGCFSLVSTKLPSYVTPCHPGIALLVGLFIANVLHSSSVSRGWITAGLSFGAAIGLGIFCAFGGPLEERIPGIRPLAIGGLFLAVASLLGVAFATRLRSDIAMRSFVVGSVCLSITLICFGPAILDQGRTDLDRLQAEFSQAPTTHWIVTGSTEPSWVFYSQGRVHPESWITTNSTLGNERIHPESMASIVRSSENTGRDVPMFLDGEFLRIIPAAEARLAERP